MIEQIKSGLNFEEINQRFSRDSYISEILETFIHSVSYKETHQDTKSRKPVSQTTLETETEMECIDQ